MPTQLDGTTQVKGSTIGAPELSSTAVTPAVYGDATHVPQVTVDQDGRITDAASVAITGVPAATHNILSATHGDTLVDTVVLGDVLIGNATPKWARLAGQITATRKFLRQLGNGAISALPAWDTLVIGDLPSSIKDAGVNLLVDGAGSAVIDGTKYFFAWPFGGTLIGWDLIADQSGNITFDIKDAAYASFPGSAASIFGTVPALASAQKNQASSLAITITKGHWAEVVITGAATLIKCTLALYITRT